MARIIKARHIFDWTGKLKMRYTYRVINIQMPQTGRIRKA